MPRSNAFMQLFHDLAEADSEGRCAAALAVRRQLMQGSEEDAEDLQYTLKRLVRGVTSSRAMARQGYSLALAEVLSAFPAQLSPALELVRQQTELLSGLKQSEQKERLLGRLFAYSGILEAGCIRDVAARAGNSEKTSQQFGQALAETGRALYEVYRAKASLHEPVALLLVQACSEACCANASIGAPAVPAALEAWGLDALVGADWTSDVHASGIALALRVVYEDAEQAGADASELKGWPACVRKDPLAREGSRAALASLIAKLGEIVHSSTAADPLPQAFSALCRWWFRASAGRDPAVLQSHIWPALDSALFPENAYGDKEAQGLRALADIVVELRKTTTTRQQAGNTPVQKKHDSVEEVLLRGVFDHMPRGLEILVRSLCWPRATSHGAAQHAQQCIIDTLSDSTGGALQQAHPSQHLGKKRKRAGHAAPSQIPEDPVPAWPLKDKTRLAILEALQRHQAFGRMKGAFQRKWRQALISPLSPPGVRKRCAALLGELASEGAEGRAVPEQDAAVPHAASTAAVQLVHLATHGRAPDEVILTVLCLLLTASYFEPKNGERKSITKDVVIGGYSLKSFQTSVGLTSLSGGDEDLRVPVLMLADDASAANETTADDDAAPDSGRLPWQTKFWEALEDLSRRISSQMSEKVSGVEGAAVKSFALHGCMSDGSLWALRLHEWWDYIVENSPLPCGPPNSPSKKKKGRKEDTSLHCIVRLREKDDVLRKRCLTVCRAVLSDPENAGSLPTRQRRAVCGLALSLGLMLLQEGGDDVDEDDDEEEEEEEGGGIRESLREVVEVLEKIHESNSQDGSATPKRKAKASRQRTEAVAEVPRIAAELFVESVGLGKEVAKSAWRELGEFTSDETVLSLCGSVRNSTEFTDKEEHEEDDENDDDEKMTAEKAAKIARFQQATAAVKAAREREAAESKEKNQDAAKPDGEDEEASADEVVLGSDEVWDQLLDDGGGDGPSSLLEAFASSGIQGDDAAGKQQSKRMQRLRARQEELARKFREIELLELFLTRHVDKRQVSRRVLQELYEAMLQASSKAAGTASDNAKKGTKASNMNRQLEQDLAQKLAQAMKRALKQVSAAAVIREVCQWHPEDEWANYARAVFATGQSPKAGSAGQQPLEVGAAFLYWLCCVHRAKFLSRTGASEDDENAGWTLAEELLLAVLKDWSDKKNCVKWAEAFFGIFASRAPQVLTRLPWLDQVRASRSPFVQRSQLKFVSEQVLRASSSASFAGTFVELCAELLEGTLDEAASAPVSDGDAASGQTAAQRQKLRCDALQGLCKALKIISQRQRDSRTTTQGAPSSPDMKPLIAAGIARRVTSCARRVMDSLLEKRGPIYFRCVHVLRAIRPADGTQSGGSGSESAGASAKKLRKKSSPFLSPKVPPQDGKTALPGTGKPEKGSKRQRNETNGFFGEL